VCKFRPRAALAIFGTSDCSRRILPLIARHRFGTMATVALPIMTPDPITKLVLTIRVTHAGLCRPGKLPEA
jgi:hypothetical protein